MLHGYTPADTATRISTARRFGDQAGEACAAKAEELRADFREKAFAFIRNYAAANARFTGEDCTNAAICAGIRPHDARAFGPVYARAIRDGVMKVIGIVPRVKGHGSMGGKLYESCCRALPEF